MPANLYDPISYILQQPGKRLRPQLVLDAVEMFGGDREQACHVAMAFEMLHNFTLIHDDIMDAAPIRRGLPTVYKKWDVNIAILSGDALAILAFQQLLKLKCDDKIIIDIADLFSRTSIEICEGQQFDLDFETREEVSISEYINMIRLKTAVMFAGCLQAGAKLASADPESQQALYDFGIHLGLAFQLTDDVLDIYGDEQTFGKAIGGDIRDNKKTYIYLKAIEKASEEQKARLVQLFSVPTTDFESKYATVRAIFDTIGVKAYAEEQIAKYAQMARNELDRVKADPARKQVLNNLVDKLMNRQK